MIAVDTNVLLRYLLHDDEAQAARVDTIFDAAETILITDVVLSAEYNRPPTARLGRVRSR